MKWTYMYKSSQLVKYGDLEKKKSFGKKANKRIPQNL